MTDYTGTLRLVLSNQDAVVCTPDDRDEDALIVRVASVLPGQVELLFTGNQRVDRSTNWRPRKGFHK